MPYGNGSRARPGSVGAKDCGQNWQDAVVGGFDDYRQVSQGEYLLDPRKRGRIVQGVKFRGPTTEVKTSSMEAWSTPPIMVSTGLDPNGIGAHPSSRGRTAADRRAAAGPHSLMARRTFSLFTDGRRQDLAQLEQPSSARAVRRPPLLPGAGGVTTMVAPTVMVTPAFSPGGSAPSGSDDGLPFTVEQSADPASTATQRPLAHSGGCGNILTPPLPSLRCDSADRLFSSRQVSRSPCQSLSPSPHPRSILRSAPSLSNSPRSCSASSSKRVSFAGDCKVPPPTTINELLTMCRLASDEGEQGIVIAGREAGSESRIGKAKAAESSSDGNGLPSAIRRKSMEASDVFRHSLLRCGV